MGRISRITLLLTFLAVTIFGGTVTENVQFTDSRSGKTYDLYEALDAGHYVLVHMSWVG